MVGYDNGKTNQTDDIKKTKQQPRHRSFVIIFSYILNGILIASLFFLWFIIEGDKKGLEQTNTILTQENSKLKQSYEKAKNDLATEKTTNNALQDEIMSLQNQLVEDRQDRVIETPSVTEQSSGTNEYIDIGSTKEDVKRIMGTPSTIRDLTFFTVWNYGSSSINFDENGKVEGWDNRGNNLKLK